MKNVEAAYLAGIIDGEGTITLTKMSNTQNRRPVISIASTDLELLTYIQELTGGCISNKKNYKPSKHKNSFSLVIKSKETVFAILGAIAPYLRVASKKKRGEFILKHYENVTPRNGKYNKETLMQKQKFEDDFFSL